MFTPNLPFLVELEITPTKHTSCYIVKEDNGSSDLHFYMKGGVDFGNEPEIQLSFLVPSFKEPFCLKHIQNRSVNLCIIYVTL